MPKTNIVQSLNMKAVSAGTNLSAVCRRAGVNRATLAKWKNKEPKTLTLLRKLEQAITDIATERAAEPVS